MSEKFYETTLGDDVSVTVAYEYTPYQPQRSDCPAWDAEVTINAVMVDGVDSKDILDLLNGPCVHDIEQEILQHEALKDE